MPEYLDFYWGVGEEFELPEFLYNERLTREVKEFLVTEHDLTEGHSGYVRLDFFGIAQSVHIEEADQDDD